MQGRTVTPLSIMSEAIIVKNLPAVPQMNQVYGRMGFKPQKADIPASLKPLVEETIHLGRELVQPLACYGFLSVQRTEPDHLTLENGFTIESRKVAQWMGGCSGLYLAAVTLGADLDRKVTELSTSGEMTRAFLLNAYGAEAAEALMESLDREIARVAASGNLTTTKRYSPGYGDWHLSAQRELLEILQAHSIGIQLSDHFLMIPEKSVSAIIGVKPRIGEI